MKIREKFLWTHLIVAVTPVLLSFVLLITISWINSRREAAKSLSELVDERIGKINENIDQHLTYAYLMSRNVVLRKNGRPRILNSDWKRIPPIFNVAVFEITKKDKAVMQDFLETEDVAYLSTPEQLRKMWRKMSAPLFHRGYKRAFVFVANGHVVVRNVALLYDYKLEEKKGMIIMSFPITQNYLKNLIERQSRTYLYCRVSNNIVFSDNEMRNHETENQILRLSMKQKSHAPVIKISEKGRYYLYETTLFSQNATLHQPRREIASIGIIKPIELTDRFFVLFRWVSLIVTLISIAAGVAMALWRSRLFTLPLLALDKDVRRFKKDYHPIPHSEKSEDEIDMLRESFVEMSESIFDYKNKIDAFNSKLTEEVESKTRELWRKIRVLTLINEFSAFILKTEKLEENSFLKKSMDFIGKLLKLQRLALYSMHALTLTKEEQWFPQKQNHIDESRESELQQRVALRIFRGKSYVIKSAGSFTIQACPIYFSDRLEYVMVFCGEKRKKEHIMESFETIANLISMAVYSIRINEDRIQSEKMASLGQFAGTIIHDIKNPLGLIKGAVEVLSDDDFTVKEKEKYAELLKNEVDLLVDMLNDILDFARGKIILHAEEVDLRALIKDLVSFYQKKLKEHQIRVVTQFGRQKIIIHADRNRLWRSLSNLVSNAIEAMEPGGKLTLSAEKKTRDVVIKVGDTGQGIPPEIKDKIFTAYFTHGKKGGTGLGLSIVKKIIESHGGSIVCRSTQGKGTDFFIYLPY